MENKKKGDFSTHNTLKSYIQKVTVEHSTDAFALATSRNQEAFKQDGTILIPFSSKKLPDYFQEAFQKNLLSFKILPAIELVGNTNIGFISTNNCLRITLSQENIAIQFKISVPFSLEEIAKIGIAAAKAATNQKNISLCSFSNSSLLYTTQALLRENGFLIEDAKEIKEKQSNAASNQIHEEKKIIKPLKFFSSSKNPLEEKKKS
jgi:hypothetical protein